MTLVRVNPWRTAPTFNTLFNRFFNDNFFPETSGTGETGTVSTWHPVVDVYEENDAYIVKADLPGVKKEDIVIDVEDRVLTLKGERSSEKETEEKNVYRRERSYGTFKRLFTLPDNVEAENIHAELKDGVLEIKITKPEEKKPRHITVN